MVGEVEFEFVIESVPLLNESESDKLGLDVPFVELFVIDGESESLAELVGSSVWLILSEFSWESDDVESNVLVPVMVADTLLESDAESLFVKVPVVSLLEVIDWDTGSTDKLCVLSDKDSLTEFEDMTDSVPVTETSTDFDTDADSLTETSCDGDLVVVVDLDGLGESDMLVSPVNVEVDERETVMLIDVVAVTDAIVEPLDVTVVVTVCEGDVEKETSSLMVVVFEYVADTVTVSLRDCVVDFDTEPSAVRDNVDDNELENDFDAVADAVTVELSVEVRV